ncbi:hypothetical protein NMY22_g1034 [Coprinellus aureogranulatus]|nr:hypothetical protein NMY22_g1034 [Coprinellus aureogranulatus]
MLAVILVEDHGGGLPLLSSHPRNSPSQIGRPPHPVQPLANEVLGEAARVVVAPGPSFKRAYRIGDGGKSEEYRIDDGGNNEESNEVPANGQ